MQPTLYSPEQVAGLLGLHVRTVRNYVRAGRLKAVRIGKQYRIAEEDLAAMTGRPKAAFRTEPPGRHRHIEVSSIVEIDAISPAEANRVTTLLGGICSGRRPPDEPLRVETIYNEERARLKIILVGELETHADLFKLILTVLKS